MPRRARGLRRKYLQRPVDETFAAILLFGLIVIGFGSAALRPNVEQGLGLALALGIVFTAPRGSFGKIRISMPALLLMAVWVLSASWAPSQVHWLAATRPQIAGMSFAMLAVSRLSVDAVTRTCLNAMYFVVGLSWFESLINSSARGSGGWSGNFIHKNPMSAFMALTILSILLLEDRKRARRIFLPASFGLVLLSQSATGLAMTLAVPILVGTLRTFTKGQRREATARLVASMTGIIMVIALMVSQAETLLGTYGKDTTLTGRTEIWSAALPLIAERPLTGYGPGFWAQRSAGPGLEISAEAGFFTAHAHNTFIELLLNIGIIGLAAWLLLFAATMRSGFRLIDVRSDAGMWILGFGALTVLWSIAENAHRGGHLWLLVAMHVLALGELDRARREKPAAPDPLGSLRRAPV